MAWLNEFLESIDFDWLHSCLFNACLIECHEKDESIT